VSEDKLKQAKAIRHLQDSEVEAERKRFAARMRQCGKTRMMTNQYLAWAKEQFPMLADKIDELTKWLEAEEEA